MPEIVKQVGVQTSTTAVPKMHNFQSDITNFVSTKTLTPSVEHKYTVDTISENAILTVNSDMIPNQETYVIFINNASTEVTITINPVSGATTKYTGDFDNREITCGAGECLEISILKLVNGSTNYYFVRGA